MRRVGLSMIAAGCALGAGFALSAPAFAQAGANDNVTNTPIKHVVIIIGENRTFDHVFGTWTPPIKGQTVWNLLSEGIVNADGTPGPNFAKAQQWQASQTGTFSNHPTKTTAYSTLPPINAQGDPSANFTNFWTAKAVEPGLWFQWVNLLLTGSPNPSVVIAGQPDPRFPSNLMSGPVPITKYVGYDNYLSSPVHRFFQMWQQTDCDIKAATPQNPSGCQNDLFPWTEVTTGTGSNGKTTAPANDETTGEGSTSMEFFNAAAGDASVFVGLANEYAINDNFHQSIMGGTGANHIFLGYGGPIFYADANGNPVVPPSNQIENPNSQSGTNNWWVQDGYSGGSYVDCSDQTQPGIGPVWSYLNSLPYKAWKGDCKKGAYYLVNNYNPGYLGTGVADKLGPQVFTIPPSRQRNLALLLEAHKISWKYYGEGWASGSELGEGGSYCNICNPFLYSTQVMTNPTLRAKNQDILDLYNDIANNSLPAVSIVKPDGLLDGHPASSKFGLFEGFSKKIIDLIKNNPSVWANTAIFITEDEGGGYYDSGYIQPVDFFGDGTRIPLLVISPFSQGVGVSHEYGDHVSLDKFIEANWGIETISPSGRDNLPNPIVSASNAYAPQNAPAIGDMMSMFKFPK